MPRCHWAVGKLLARLIGAATLLASCIAVAPTQASAEDGPHVAASLVAEERLIVPGQPLHLALRQQIETGWHTYWSNPGDSGLPTTIDWALPQEFKAGPIVWPTPERFAYGPVVGYGYAHEIFLPVTIDIPSDLPLGRDIVLAARASWLVCSETCIPEEAELSLSLPVGTTSEQDSRWAEAFAATRARTPAPNPFTATATRTGDEISLRIAMGDATGLRDVTFFPADMDVVDASVPQATSADSEGLTVTVRRDGSNPPPTMLNGVLAFRDLRAQAPGMFGSIMVSTPIAVAAPSTQADLGFTGALLLALLGGLLLNLMPCVLPVLSIKALGLVEHARLAPRAARLHGIAYATGVLGSFAVIGGTLIGLRAAGAAIGWGFQLQSPFFVVAMIYLLFAVGLNLSGVFSFGDRVAGVGSGLAGRDGYGGSFFTGALATLIATPCSAPFMAAATGYAISQSWYISLVVLEAVGLGLALPYLVVAFSPGARRLLPKPGVWMLRLKQGLAFPVYGTAVWLVFVLTQETDATHVTAVLAGLVLIAFAAWLADAARSNEGRWQRFGHGLAALSVIGACALVYVTEGDSTASAGRTVGAAEIGWEPFSKANLDRLRAEGRPIFIDFTAAWCITCKVNERVALADPAVRKVFAEDDIATLRADWTRQDAGITRVLEANGRAGVPLYLFYPKPGPAGESRAAKILPQILTAETLLHAMRGS